MTLSVRQAKGADEITTLVASTTETADGTGSAGVRLTIADALAFILDVTAAATDATDTLDVYVQTRVNDGSGANWLDVVHFSQVLGNGGAKQYVSKIVRNLATAEYETGTALGAAAVRHIFGDEWRARWDIVDSGDANQSFTFSLTAIPM